MPRVPSYSVRLILNTALWLTGLGLVVRASGAVKEIIFARAFGVSAETDAFILAITYATFLPIILGGALATALIAELARWRQESKARLASLSRWIVVASLFCAVLTYLLAPWLLPAIFNVAPEALDKCVAYARMLAPLAFAMVMSTAMGALLNSAKQFYVPAISALATPVIMMVTIFVMAERWGVDAAVYGMVAGGLIEALVLALRIFPQRDYFFSAGSATVDGGFQLDFFKAVAVLSLAATIAALFTVVDQIFLSRLETGAVTHFNYASKVNSLLIGIFGTAFSVAIYPYLSDLAAQRDSAGLKRLTWHLAAVVLPVMGCATLVVYVFSYQIVELLFARGNFTQASVAEVSVIQRIFALQLVFYVAGLLVMRVLNAMGSTRVVFVVSCVGLAATALFDWLFYRSMGAGGIALSAVLTSAVSFVVAAFFVKSALARPG